jgi:hypothetical protein
MSQIVFSFQVHSGKDLLAFLFNDFLLFATMKNSSTHWQTLLFDNNSHLQLKVYRSVRAFDDDYVQR